MISLREARKRVVDVLGKDQVPVNPTLRGWANKGFISGKIEGTSRGAKYLDLIVAEIITAIKLKNEYGYKLVDIAKFRDAARLNEDNITEINQYRKKLYDYTHYLDKKFNEMNNIGKSDDPEEKLKIMEKKLDKSKKFDFKISILKAYNEEFWKTINLYISVNNTF